MRSKLLQAMGVANGLAVGTDATNDEHAIIVPFSVRRRGVETRLVVGDGQHNEVGARRSEATVAAPWMAMACVSTHGHETRRKAGFFFPYTRRSETKGALTR